MSKLLECLFENFDRIFDLSVRQVSVDCQSDAGFRTEEFLFFQVTSDGYSQSLVPCLQANESLTFKRL